MNRQSLDFARDKTLPRYGDLEGAYERGSRYVFKKKENAEEPPATARALRKFDQLGDALEWAKNNLGYDCFLVISI